VVAARLALSARAARQIAPRTTLFYVAEEMGSKWIFLFRKWREVRLYQIAPISTNLVLAYLGQHVLGMERSY
jgi:hypothetical protein